MIANLLKSKEIQSLQGTQTTQQQKQIKQLKMGPRGRQTFLKRKHMNDLQAYEKVLRITNHHGNPN